MPDLYISFLIFSGLVVCARFCFDCFAQNFHGAYIYLVSLEYLFSLFFHWNW